MGDTSLLASTRQTDLVSISVDVKHVPLRLLPTSKVLNQELRQRAAAQAMRKAHGWSIQSIRLSREGNPMTKHKKTYIVKAWSAHCNVWFKARSQLGLARLPSWY